MACESVRYTRNDLLPDPSMTSAFPSSRQNSKCEFRRVTLRRSRRRECGDGPKSFHIRSCLAAQPNSPPERGDSLTAPAKSSFRSLAGRISLRKPFVHEQTRHTEEKC